MHTILVPLDGSPLSEYALPIACNIAQRSGAALGLVHVRVRATPAPISVEGLPVIDEHLQSLRSVHELTYLERIRDRLAADPDLFITVAILDPLDADVHDLTIPDMLVNYAAATDTDLIVMTTHGRGGFARFWLGSVADALVRASPVPILLLRPDEGMPEPDRGRAIQRILIPLDGSARSETIVEHALAFGQLIQPEYTLLRVVAPFVLGAAAPFTTPTDFDPDRTRRLQTEAQDYLDSVAQRLQTRGAQVRTRVLISEQVAAAILEDACQHDIDLIAMSTAGRSGLTRLLIGSVADKVLRRAEKPLLLYRPTSPYDRVRYQPASAAADTPRRTVQEEVLR
jgi:nucleotide-binding universal stress UspA family protein